MRFYTGKGDQGATDLLGARVAKNDPVIEVIGSLDEATSSIGQARALASGTEMQQWLMQTQRDLYLIMAELAFTDAIRPDAYHLAAERTSWLEQVTDEIGSRVDLPPHFILPGDTIPGAALDVARTVARRAERRAVELAATGSLPNPEIVRYLNRLSSLLFIAARYEDHLAGVDPTKAKVESQR